MDEQLQILARVEELGKKPGNNVCAECPERHPTWVSLIRPAFRGGEVMGVFVCEGCSRHHHQLGRKISEVKSVTMATKWSFKELGYVSKSGNQMVNSVYEGDEDECADDKEIITFDKEEAAKLRGEYIHKKYSERKYFSEDRFHATMIKLNPSYKRYDEVSTRGSSPRRASMMAGTITQVPSTPVSAKNRRASMDSPKQSPTKEDNAAAAPPETPTKKSKDLGAMLRNIKEMDDSSHTTSRRAIPSSASLTTPRNNRRRSVMTSSTNSVTGAADPYSRQRQSILAEVSPAELIQLGMSEDGSQRGGGGGGGDDNGDDLGSSERSARSISRRNRRQSTFLREEDSLSGSRRGESSSRRQRHSILNSRDEDSLSGSRRGESSSRRQRHTILNREEDSLSGSRRGDSSSRRQRHSVLNRENSERSLSSTSQRGSRSRRESLRGSDRSHSARDVGRGDRNRRRQSLLRPEKDLESESESEAERDPLFEESRNNRNSSGLLPSSLQISDGASQQQQLAPVHSSLKRTTQSMRSSRTSVSISDGPRQQQSMRSGRTSVVLQEPAEMVENKKNLDKRRTSMLLAGERLSRRSIVDQSSSQSMRESRTSDGYSPPRPLHESTSNASLRSSDRSRRSERSSRSTTKSPSRDKDSSPSRRSKRSSNGMKDKSDGSTRSRHMDGSDPENSTRTKRSATTTGFSARSSRSKREGRTSGSRKSSSPSRRIKKSATMSTYEDAKKEMRHSRSVGTLGELIMSSTTSGSGSGSGSQNFDWKAHKKSVEARGQGDIDDDPLLKSTHHERKSDPLSKGSGHNRKGSNKKATKVKRHHSDGSIGDSDSDDSSEGRSKARRTKSEKKPDRRSMRKIPSSKAMSRSSSTGKIFADGAEAGHLRGSSRGAGKFNRRKSQSARNLIGIDLSDLGGGDGEESKKSSRSKSKSRKSERRDSSTADKYKNLENGVANSSYSGGSLGLLMTNTAEKEAATKDKASSSTSYSNLSAAAGTLGFLAQPSSSMSAKMSDVFGIKGAELKKAGRKSIVTQWLSPTDVAAAAKAAIESNKEQEAKDAAAAAESKEGKNKHKSYDDAIVAQWLTTSAT